MPTLASVARGPSRLRPLLLTVTALAGFLAPTASAFQAPFIGSVPVAAVWPADGATDVPSRTEIRVRFEHPMSPTAAELSWLSPDENAGYRATGPFRYDPEAREFTLPVVLTPGAKYQLIPHLPSMGGGGFCAVKGAPAALFSWSFSTASPKSASEDEPAPRVVSVDPPPGAAVGRLAPVKVVFDRPMDPHSYGLDRGLHQSPGRPSQVVEASYDAPARRFDLLVRPSSDAAWSVDLAGFRSAEGVPAEPVRVAYKTEDDPFSRVLRDRFELAAGSPRLREVVERAREASRKIESATVRVATDKIELLPHSFPDRGVMTQYRAVGYSRSAATFRKGPGDKFEVDTASSPWGSLRVGFDGATCWIDVTNVRFRYESDRPGGVSILVLPVDHAERDVSIADPFDAAGKATVDDLIRDLKLEYGGEADLNGRRCHEVRSWIVEDGEGHCRRWFLDAETFLTARVQPSAGRTLDFTYEGINAPIPDETFRVPDGASRRIDRAGDGFMKWFIGARDGSDGEPAFYYGTRKGGLKVSRKPD